MEVVIYEIYNICDLYVEGLMPVQIAMGMTENGAYMYGCN